MEHKERVEKLEEFRAEGQRVYPPVFVGREDVIRDIEHTADIVYRKWKAGTPGASRHGLTRLVQGAPGAGKTSLLTHMEAKWGRETPGPNVPVCVVLDIEEMDSIDKLQEAVERGVPTSMLREWGAPLFRAIAKPLLSAGGPSGVGAGVAIDAAGAAMQRRAGGGGRPANTKTLPAPLVVMIDEAQNVEPFSAQAAGLRLLHQSAGAGGIPVLPVFAGLGYLKTHLRQKGIGISRYTHPADCFHALEGLPPGRCRELLGGWLNHFDVVALPGEFDPWLDAMVRDTQGWPMHVKSFLDELAGQLAGSKDSGLLSSACLGGVRVGAAKLRAAYYNDRYDETLDIHRRAVAQAMAPMRPGEALYLDKIAAIVDRACGNGGVGGEVRAALLHSGFLQQIKERYHCPIPSLASHALMRGMDDGDAHRAALLGQPDELRRLARDGFDVEVRDACGRTPLLAAAECRWAAAVEVLIEAGADPDAADDVGATPRSEWAEFAWPDPSGRGANPPHPALI